MAIKTLQGSSIISRDSASYGAFLENSSTVYADYTISVGKNAISGGPITVNSGVTVTVPSDSVWTVV